jgi:hypothetical protein
VTVSLGLPIALSSKHFRYGFPRWNKLCLGLTDTETPFLRLQIY